MITYGTQYVSNPVPPYFIYGYTYTHTHTHTYTDCDCTQLQQKQIDQFCKARGMDDEAYTLPGENERRSVFYRHILINDKAQTLFCFIPKVGCTNLKVLFFVVQGECVCCLLYTSPSPRDATLSRMPSSA